MQGSTLFFVLENVLVDPFMADSDITFRPEPEADLLGAPVLSEQSSDVTPDSIANTTTDYRSSWVICL